MIKVERDPLDYAFMRINLNGNAEQIAQEYVGLTIKLLDEYPAILDRAQWYLEDVRSLRIMKREGKQ